MNNISAVNKVDSMYKVSKNIRNYFRFNLLALNFSVQISIFKELKDKKGGVFMVEVVDHLDDVWMPESC